MWVLLLCLLHTSGLPWFQKIVRLNDFNFNQPTCSLQLVHLNEMRRDRLRIWKITEDDWMHDIKWEICLTHKMEGSIGKSHLGFLSPRSGASTITMKKIIFFLYILSLPENSPFEQVLTQKYRHALLRRLWSMFKLLEGECRLWGSSCT